MNGNQGKSQIEACGTGYWHNGMLSNTALSGKTGHIQALLGIIVAKGILWHGERLLT